MGVGEYCSPDLRVASSNWSDRYFNKETRWNATAYPRSQIDYTLRCMFPRWSDWDVSYTRKGALKASLREILKLFAGLSAIVGVIYTFRKGQAGAKAAMGTVMENIRRFVADGLNAVGRRL